MVMLCYNQTLLFLIISALNFRIFQSMGQCFIANVRLPSGSIFEQFLGPRVKEHKGVVRRHGEDSLSTLHFLTPGYAYDSLEKGPPSIRTISRLQSSARLLAAAKACAAPNHFIFQRQHGEPHLPPSPYHQRID